LRIFGSNRLPFHRNPLRRPGGPCGRRCTHGDAVVRRQSRIFFGNACGATDPPPKASEFFVSIRFRESESIRVSMNRMFLLALLVAPLAAFAADPPAKPPLTPADNLVVDGVPPIPGELPEQVGRYTESRAATMQDWHPTRAEILITTRFGDTNQLHQVIQPGGARTQLTFFADRVDGGSFEPTKGEYLIFSKGAGGNEFNQNYRYDLATGDITLLTDGKSRNSGPSWSNKGDRIAYTSTRRNGADTDIYVQSPTDPKTDHLLAEVKGRRTTSFCWCRKKFRLTRPTSGPSRRRPVKKKKSPRGPRKALKKLPTRRRCFQKTAKESL
jgi:hypothetical protein